VRHRQSHQPDSIYCQLVAPNIALSLTLCFQTPVNTAHLRTVACTCYDCRVRDGVDFTDLSVKEREEAKKWYNADQPSSSRMYGPTVTSAYRLWLKWNLTSTGGKAPYYKGDLVKKREEVATAVGAAMAAVKLE
jgi:hypothetical protein